MPSDVTFSVLNTFAVKFMCELRVHVVSGCFHRSGVHEVEHLGGGARHAALFSGELLSSLLSSSSPSILPTSLSLSVALHGNALPSASYLGKLFGFCPTDFSLHQFLDN